MYSMMRESMSILSSEQGEHLTNDYVSVSRFPRENTVSSPMAVISRPFQQVS